MKKLGLILITPLITSVPNNAYSTSYEYQFEKASNEGVLAWILDASTKVMYQYARSQTKVEGENTVKTIGDYKVPFLPGVRDFEVAVCTNDKVAKWSEPWLNGVKYVGETTVFSHFFNALAERNIKKYTVSQGTPIEIVSKDYSSAGFKRFFKFNYSWMIENDYEYNHYANQTEGDFDVIHSFQNNGEYDVHGQIYSNYEIGFDISIGGTFNGEYAEFAGVKWKPLWGRDMGIYNCGTTKVYVERNTKPEVSNVKFTRWSNGRASYLALNFDTNDKHTKNDSLIIKSEFTYDGVSYHQINRTHFTDVGYIPAEKKEKYRYRLTVSDGGMSTIVEGKVQL